MLTSVMPSAESADVRLVNTAVVRRDFRKSTMRRSIALASPCVPAVSKSVTGSMITFWGLKLSISLCMLTRCISSPNIVGRDALILSRPLFTHCFRFRPIELILRRSWLSDSSNAK